MRLFQLNMPSQHDIQQVVILSSQHNPSTHLRQIIHLYHNILISRLHPMARVVLEALKNKLIHNRKQAAMRRLQHLQLIPSRQHKIL